MNRDVCEHFNPVDLPCAKCEKPTLREAATIAVQAYDAHEPLAVVMEDLRAALAEPVLEPVAWMIYTEGGTSAYVTDNPNDLVGAYRALALYTAPPQRKPLTDEELDALAIDEDGLPNSHIEFARAIERAHGIKDAGCDHCCHVLYAATKCRNCGRVTE